MNNFSSTLLLLSDPLGYIWYPGCDKESDSIEEMMSRIHATQDLIVGKLHPEDYLDMLDAQGFDVYQLLDNWEAVCYQ